MSKGGGAWETHGMRIDRLDHLVLTVADLDATIAFYRDVLGMEAQTFGDGRRALRFGTSKINLHDSAGRPAPTRRRPCPARPTCA
ncbi:VOC family protein [Pseudonocardia sp. T1-2H]|uniref:VOC family protein n=1 Tax=Pseudonocardia sp. T1-2H TaxID=3128899 RepID=UPI00310156B7